MIRTQWMFDEEEWVSAEGPESRQEGPEGGPTGDPVTSVKTS